MKVKRIKKRNIWIKKWGKSILDLTIQVIKLIITLLG
jgi:hypothetical protein